MSLTIQRAADSRPRMLCDLAEQVLQFLLKIGLDVEVVPRASGFIEHVEIQDGKLRVDPNAPASGLLHEAGHLAIVPASYRHFLSGDLMVGIKRIFAEVDLAAFEPDSPLQRALLQIGDSEVTAWAWAAGIAAGVPEEAIILDHEYSGEGADIRTALAAKSYLGINGLSHAGFCVMRPNPYRPLPVYPALAFWLQP